MDEDYEDDGFLDCSEMFNEFDDVTDIGAVNAIVSHEDLLASTVSITSEGAYILTLPWGDIYVYSPQGKCLYWQSFNAFGGYGVPEEANAVTDPKTTPLHVAALKGDVRMAEILLGFGLSTKAKDIRGHTPLDIANDMGNEGVAKLLMEHDEQILGTLPPILGLE